MLKNAHRGMMTSFPPAPPGTNDQLSPIRSSRPSLQGVATGLLDDHLKHCVLDAAKVSDEAAHEKIQESTAAVNRLIRS